jgi:arylsulfatase A-like enzyme
MNQPNILIIMTDQQRADTIGSYGADICRTPAIDKLAASGTRFDNAYTVCALCSPARASVYTGLYPRNHGLLANEYEFHDNARLISQDFAEAGYRCGLVGKWHCGEEKLPGDFGFEGMNVPGYGNATATVEYQDYLSRNDLEQGEIIPLGTGWSTNLLLRGKITGPVEASAPYFLAEQTIDMLKDYREGDMPFLHFCNFWGPHAPYLPTEPYASMYDAAQIPPWPNFYDDLNNKPNAHRRYRDAFVGEDNELRDWDEWSKWAASYFGFATMIDAQIGRILDALEELDMAENTVVLFTADHGEHCGAHGGIHDKFSMMYQEMVHIPFILRMPETAGGQVIRNPINNIDILPTLLELAGIEPERELDGRSLVPLLQQNDEAAEWEEDVFTVFYGHHNVTYQARMINDGRYKYVFNAPEIDELYDLVRDPWEMHNLIDDPDYEAIKKHKRDRLIHWTEKTDDELALWIRNLFAERTRTLPQDYEPYRH